MINRIIIRIKVLQIIYAYYQKDSKDIALAENELLHSLQKSYDLYHYLLALIITLTDVEQKRLDKNKHKYLATEEEKNPDTRFINNRLAEQLSKNKQLLAFSNEKGSVWTDEDVFLKKILDQIISSDIYAEYLKSPDNYESDKEFWRKIFKQYILASEELSELLEDKSIYWNDDLDVIGTFALKTIKRFEESTAPDEPLLPMFKDEEDRRFAISLLRQSILEGQSHNARIEKHIKNWELDRIASIDLYIMQVAITELLKFPSIPINVTLNEYIDIAKYYSTSKSGTFINGTLDAIVQELKSEKILFKN
ncbi:MAG: transcription antitermination factor NusB [Dysgonamonadaceae bacterium]|jgi:N utilization substance protein B|nr:transcription antitermination factor NusB [Dysgonamonadaceae bacterium]